MGEGKSGQELQLELGEVWGKKNENPKGSGTHGDRGGRGDGRKGGGRSYVRKGGLTKGKGSEVGSTNVEKKKKTKK